MKKVLMKSAISSLNLMPPSMLSRIEQLARLAQGKGWGAGTVRQEVHAALSLLSAGDRSSLVAIDVGANIGRWTSSLLEAEPKSTVYAFEPSLAAFGSLQQSLGEDRRVHLARTALGVTEGLSTLFSNESGSGLASLTKRRLDHFDIEFNYSEEVRITTLDTWLASNQIPGVPSLLKMDVEGHELDVLHGSEKAMRGIKVVQFEFGGCNIDTRTYFQDFFYFFQEAGFRILRLGPKGLTHVARYTENEESFTTTNYFAQRI